MNNCNTNQLIYLQVAQLQFKMPNETNKISILKLMDETRFDRQQWIKDPEKLVTLHDILNKFPRFTDYKGELVKLFISNQFLLDLMFYMSNN